MLKNWFVIIALAVIGLVLGWYWLQAGRVPDGVIPQGDTESVVTTIAALAGAVTTLAGAISGAAMKLIEYRKASLELDAQALANEKARREMQGD